MVNQQLLDYINQQTQQKIPKETISSNLLSQGWQPKDIEEGFNVISSSVTAGQNPAGLVKPATAVWKIIAVSLVGVAIVGSGIYFTSQKFLKSEVTPRVSNEVSVQLPTSQPTETATSTKQLVEQSQPQNPTKQLVEQSRPVQATIKQEAPKTQVGVTRAKGVEEANLILADKLSSCTPYKITLKHPFTGEMIVREILGIVNGKCGYAEEMPDDGKMECKYTENERKAVAQYYKDLSIEGPAVTSVNINMGSGDQKTTYTVNGKVVNNPLQEAMDSGVCIISGY